MPLRENCSNEALRQNTQTEIAAGKKPNEAYAIAQDVMRRACRAAGKPVPKRARTQEYLEAALESAKQLLPPWAYAMVHNAALPKAGGRVRAKMRKLQAQAKVIADPTTLKTATPEQREMILKSFVPVVRKGFISGSVDGGVHVHGLDRMAKITQNDGAHRHWFKLPGGGFLISEEDGMHAHAIVDATIGGGAHTHAVYSDAFDALMHTSVDGEHAHGQQIETTLIDGDHVHVLTLPDGTAIKSMTVAEYLAMFNQAPVSAPLPPCSVFMGALDTIRMQQMQIEYLTTELAEEEAEEEQEEEAEEYPIAMEIIGQHVDGFDVGFADNDYGFSVKGDGHFDEGDVVDIVGDEIVKKSDRLFAMGIIEADGYLAQIETRKKMARVVEWSGPTSGAPIIFLTASPNELEAARGASVVGSDAQAFLEHYLKPLNLKRDDVVVGSIAPHWMPDPIDTDSIAPWLKKTKKRLEAHPGAVVVALGKTAKSLLGDLARVWVPHPAVVRKSGDAEQVHRKLKRISLDASKVSGDTSNKSPELKVDNLADADCEPGNRIVTVKSARDEAQIVYGVVLDPNMIDTQNDWAPPAEIQETAHGYLEKSRVVGLEHERRARAKVVESFVEQYPTKSDYQAAIEGQPHKITRRPFGNDYLNSGAWVLGVKLEDPEWQDYKTGQLTGFSMGGFSVKTPSDRALMPKIEVIDLKPSI